MAITISELLKSEQESEKEVLENPSGTYKKNGVQRPEEEVQLKSLYLDKPEKKKTQKDPTSDLIWLPRCAPQEMIESVVYNADVDFNGNVYFVFATTTQESWVCPTKKCLDQNFIYRGDLNIRRVDSLFELSAVYSAFTKNLSPNVITRKKCYLLDNPANESYEVYYDPSYVAVTYGKSTPRGMYIHAYENRFHRDMDILQLDAAYSNASAKKAGELVAREYGEDEAIIISDGAYIRNAVTCSYVYLDNKSVIHMTEGTVASNNDSGVLIAEVNGAYNALMMCKQRSKRVITYYYDNTSIINVFRTNRTDSMPEIKRYKDLCEEMDLKGYSINFVEIHPKTGENRDIDNKALMFFHNGCDSACTEIADIFKKDYKSIATTGRTEGKTYTNIKTDYKPRSRQKNFYQSKTYKPRYGGSKNEI